jgi:exonuclease VII small subunit
MEFQNKIKELDYIHARLEAERLALEARSKHDR